MEGGDEHPAFMGEMREYGRTDEGPPSLITAIDADDGNLVVKVCSQEEAPSRTESVRCVVRTRIPTDKKGSFHIMMYECDYDRDEHLALVYGSDVFSRTLDMSRLYPESEFKLRGVIPRIEIVRKQLNTEPSKLNQKPILLRIHSSCFTSENTGSTRCDCREQLEVSMDLMNKENKGVILYLKQEGRGIGLREKLLAYNLIDMGYDTVSANIMLNKKPDMRSYQIAVDILNDLNIKAVRLLTNNPKKVSALTEAGIMVERIPMMPRSWKERHALHNMNTQVEHTSPNNHSPHLRELDLYLVSKVKRMGHTLDIPEDILSEIEARVHDEIGKKELTHAAGVEK